MDIKGGLESNAVGAARIPSLIKELLGSFRIIGVVSLDPFVPFLEGDVIPLQPYQPVRCRICPTFQSVTATVSLSSAICRARRTLMSSKGGTRWLGAKEELDRK